MKLENLFSRVPETIPEEIFENIIVNDNFKLERIVSSGQSTALGEWYDQAENEWVLLLQGSAGLLFEGESKVMAMHPGDYILIPAHQRHRIEWTDKKQRTVWLALHYK